MTYDELKTLNGLVPRFEKLEADRMKPMPMADRQALIEERNAIQKQLVELGFEADTIPANVGAA